MMMSVHAPDIIRADSCVKCVEIILVNKNLKITVSLAHDVGAHLTVEHTLLSCTHTIYIYNAVLYYLFQ